MPPLSLSFPGGSAGKEPACNAGDLGSIPGWEDPLEKGKATHSRILVWRIPWGCKESDMTERLSLSPLSLTALLPVLRWYRAPPCPNTRFSPCALLAFSWLMSPGLNHLTNDIYTQSQEVNKVKKFLFQICLHPFFFRLGYTFFFFFHFFSKLNFFSSMDFTRIPHFLNLPFPKS